jgi:hypothetical protein
MSKRPATETEFWGRMSPEPNTGCWLWTGTVLHYGHGVIQIRKKAWQAHRLAWTLARGPIPEGAFVCHRCNVPACCNPDHLYIGDAQTNQRDVDESGHRAKGERQGLSKLTEDDVRSIRAEYRRYSDTHGAPALAKKYGVTRTPILHIINGKTWSHV